MEPKEQGGGGGCFSVYLYSSIPYDPGYVLRIQCPAILASVVTLLGAVLSFTFVPATTKEASVQSARQGKHTCPQTGYHFAQEASILLLGMEGRPFRQGVQGTQRGDGISSALLAADSW